MSAWKRHPFDCCDDDCCGGRRTGSTIGGVLANLRFPVLPRGPRRRTAHRAIIDAECEQRSTYIPPPSS